MSKDAGLLDASMFRRLAEQLREWSTTILAAADAGEVERTRETLRLHIDWLDESGDAVRPEAFETSTWQACRLGRGSRWNKTLQEYGNYGPAFLLQCLVFSFSLRGSRGSLGPEPFKEAVLQALRTLPHALRGAAEAVVTKCKYPSAATISRYRLHLDVAYMQLMQEKHRDLNERSGIYLAMMDSSPQGGRDWLLHEYSFISDACLVAAFDAASSTWAITHGHEAIDDHELHDVLQSLHCVIRKAIRRHILPPTGIGSLHQNVSHKFHAFLHGLRLECGSWAETQHLISKYFAICTDMGVESKLTMAEAVAGELFSYWCDFNMDDDEGGA